MSNEAQLFGIRNPLITMEHHMIIEAAKPKHELKQLLGLSNKQFINFKKAEIWMKKRKIKNSIGDSSNYQTKEKHVDFAKELF